MGRESVSEAIIEAISVVRGEEPDEFDFSVYDYIDLDAVEALATKSGGEWQLRFRVEEHEVAVDSQHRLTVNGHEFTWDAS